MADTYNWLILQPGALPLQPDGTVRRDREHRCTAVLIWPGDADPCRENTIMVDPCFTDAGYEYAEEQLKQIGARFADIGRIFVTHLHHDHLLHLPYDVPSPHFRPFRPTDSLPGLTVEHCPGHDSMLLALAFRAPDERAVWIVSDAVLDEAWLRAWNFYWPNQYSPEEIVETWRSVAKIIASADLIIPGHGAPVEVTEALVRHLIDTFPTARHADHCPDVADGLRARAESFE
ncbi:MAG: hypothetical protein JXA10_17770 [Anaerolineae bacterium]|nr:hypothetical protein [Anaerolineae bacterium]